VPLETVRAVVEATRCRTAAGRVFAQPQMSSTCWARFVPARHRKCHDQRERRAHVPRSCRALVLSVIVCSSFHVVIVRLAYRYSPTFTRPRRSARLVTRHVADDDQQLAADAVDLIVNTPPVAPLVEMPRFSTVAPAGAQRRAGASPPSDTTAASLVVTVTVRSLAIAESHRDADRRRHRRPGVTATVLRPQRTTDAPRHPAIHRRVDGVGRSHDDLDRADVPAASSASRTGSPVARTSAPSLPGMLRSC